MKLLVITPHYLPDGGPSAPLYAMLCEALVRRGHAVTVIAAVPHYPSGRVPPGFRGWHIRRATENGVAVIRVPVPSLDRANLFLRLLQFGSYQAGMALAGLRENYDVVLTSNPAIQVGLPFAVLSVLRRKPAIYSVHDVYPDAGIALGVFRSHLVIGGVAAAENFCLTHAKRVRILSESFTPALVKLGTPHEKLALIYDWVDTDLIRPMARCNGFSCEQSLDDYFVVMYAGNIGLSQGLETVLDAAHQLSARTDVLFLFVGDGAGKDALAVRAAGLTNVRFLPFAPRERLPEVLASANISLVTLKPGVGSVSLPSKTFSILASARPVIASVDEGSDTWNLVERSEAGICVPPGNPAALAQAILQLKYDPTRRDQMGRNGRVWAESHHSPDAAAEQFEGLCAQAMAGHKDR